MFAEYDKINTIKLIDFGIACKWQGKYEDSVQAGTLRYSPPEFVSGKDYSTDPRIDSWAVGVLLYKMVFGKYPFNGDKREELREEIINGKLVFPAKAESTEPHTKNVTETE